MPVRVACGHCGSEFSLRDDAAGKRLKCPKCQAVIEVPLDEPATGSLPASTSHDAAFQRNKFLLRQKHFSISEKYYVWDDIGQTIMFVERPTHLLRSIAALLAAIISYPVLAIPIVGGTMTFLGDNGTVAGITILVGLVAALAVPFAVFIALSPKRHVTFYTDDTKAHPLLQILQNDKFAVINATYTVLTPTGECIGLLRKNYLYDFIRKRWHGLSPDGSTILVAMEDSVVKAILRRFLGTFYGLLRTNFIIVKPDMQTLLGRFDRTFTLLDRYVLDVTADRDGYLDRRMAVAVGVMLDTGERR